MPNDGTTFEIDLPVTGKEQIDAASTSLDVLVARQDAASKAMQAAAEAVKASEAAYRTAEASADKASKAVEKLGLAAEAQWAKFEKASAAGDGKAAAKASEAIKALSERQGEARIKADELQAAMLREAATLDAAKAKVASLAEASKQLKASIEAKADPQYEKIARGLGRLGGPLAEVGEKISKVGSGFAKLKDAFGGSTGAIVGTTVLTVAMAAAFLALAAAAVESTAKVLAWSVGLADANRQAELLSHGIVQSAKGGDALNASIKAISKTLPVSNEELQGMAKNFAYAGLRGKDLENALRQSATWAARLKFGPDFAREMLSLEQQSKVFQANIASTFGGLKIEGLLGGLQKLIALLDNTTASGHAIQVVFESIFQPFVDNLTDAQFKVEAFFLQLEIWTLKALIALKPYESTIVTVVEAFAVGAAVIVGVVVVAFGLLAAAILAVVAAVGLVFVAFKDVAQNWSQIGRDIIGGIVDGITGAGAAVLSALTSVVTNAVNGVKGLLKINSPSKVFAEIGESTGEGMALGVTRSASGAQGALEDMVAPPVGGGAGIVGAGSPSASVASKPSTNLSNVHFTFNGVQGAEDAIDRFRELLTQVLEGNVTQIGATVPG